MTRSIAKLSIYLPSNRKKVKWRFRSRRKENLRRAILVFLIVWNSQRNRNNNRRRDSKKRIKCKKKKDLNPKNK